MIFDPEKPPAAIPLDLVMREACQSEEERAAEVVEFFRKANEPLPNPWQSPRRERDPEPSEVLERTFGDWERDLSKRAGSFTNEPGLVLEPRGGPLRTAEQFQVEIFRKSAPDFLQDSRFDNGDLHKSAGSAGERRKSGIKAWLLGKLALGENIAELVQHAERFDLEAANLIRTCAAELAAA